MEITVKVNDTVVRSIIRDEIRKILMGEMVKEKSKPKTKTKKRKRAVITKEIATQIKKEADAGRRRIKTGIRRIG